MNICITGASGFLGGALLNHIEKKHTASLLVRTINPKLDIEQHKVDINATSVFSKYLTNVDAVVHCAARVHIMDENNNMVSSEYKAVNTEGTINLAKQAAEAGVKRFIFISTIKVNGERTEKYPFTHADKHCPEDPYSISKSLAELALLDISKKTGLEVVIIRPPLVYGPNVKANFASLMELVSKGLPLPFGRLKSNKRSMVYVENLIDLIINCLDNPNAANQTFLVSDDDDLSTYELVSQMGEAFGKTPFQVPIPISCLRLLGILTGKKDAINRLLSSLRVDIAFTKSTLEWTPPFTVKQGMLATVKVFNETRIK